MYDIISLLIFRRKRGKRRKGGKARRTSYTWR